MCRGLQVMLIKPQDLNPKPCTYGTCVCLSIPEPPNAPKSQPSLPLKYHKLWFGRFLFSVLLELLAGPILVV